EYRYSRSLSSTAVLPGGDRSHNSDNFALYIAATALHSATRMDSHFTLPQQRTIPATRRDSHNHTAAMTLHSATRMDSHIHCLNSAPYLRHRRRHFTSPQRRSRPLRV